MLLWRSKKKVAPPPPAAPYRYGFTLDYFRSAPDRVEQMRELLRSPFFQQVMSVLQHEIPLDSIEAVRGHRMAMRMMELMAEHPPRAGVEIEPTFGAEKEFPEMLADEKQPQE
jgi:hypothetical protein